MPTACERFLPAHSPNSWSQPRALLPCRPQKLLPSDTWTAVFRISSCLEARNDLGGLAGQRTGGRRGRWLAHPDRWRARPGTRWTHPPPGTHPSLPWQAPRADEAIKKAECPCFLAPTRRLVWSLLRTSSDHSFIVGALRARRPCQLSRHFPSQFAYFSP